MEYSGPSPQGCPYGVIPCAGGIFILIGQMRSTILEFQDIVDELILVWIFKLIIHLSLIRRSYIYLSVILSLSLSFSLSFSIACSHPHSFILVLILSPTHHFTASSSRPNPIKTSAREAAAEELFGDIFRALVYARTAYMIKLSVKRKEKNMTEKWLNIGRGERVLIKWGGRRRDGNKETGM